ncbi:MAG: cell surface protein SprA [Weeksellaceae bacterium]|nr:cell surface protein SprA [Weeksellaceae bacterium]
MSIFWVRTLCFFLALAPLYIVNAQEVEQDTLQLQYPFTYQTGGLFLDNPLQYSATFDPATGNYILYQTLGGRQIGNPIIMTQDEYMDMLLDVSKNEYFRDKSQAFDAQFRSMRYDTDQDPDNQGLVLPSIGVRNRIFQTLFGGDKIELIPRGYASIDLGGFFQKLDNPQIMPQNRENFNIDLRQRIQMSVLGKVGENLQLEANYDTQAGFGFENRMNIGWRPRGEGGEDNIIRNIEFGNVSMPLSTSLITGAQSLFGAKGEFQFGNTYITTLFSQQQSETRNITVQGGGLVNTFKVYAKDYQMNQHYFLGHYFRDRYDNALANYPIIASQINITRLEVWVIDRGNANQQNRRSIIALRDLGDNGGQPQNDQLYNAVSNLPGIRQGNTAESAMNQSGLIDNQGQLYAAGEHYMAHENVRLLQPMEYQFFPELGYISLNQPLNDQDMLAVSFQYTLTTQPGQAYTVGEFSDQQSDVLIAKLLKSNTNVNTNSPMWDLMMKNIYSLEAMRLSPEDFRLNIFYQDPQVGSGALNYLQNTPVEDQTLLQVLNVDRLNLTGQLMQNANGTFGDGLFDYLPGVTIDQQYGRVKFTTIEPFGRTIAQKIGTTDSDYVLEDLYRELPITFEQNTQVNRYFMEGQYKSEGGEGIQLGAFNIPQGSVRVTANGLQLTEGVDYIVDYQLGRVTIINQTLKDSGVPINISMENRSMFNMQMKRLMGLNVEHRFSDRLTVGTTFMNYKERLPGATQKAQYQAEPVSNSILGANIMYNSPSEWLTRITNRIPLVNTNAPSTIQFTAEGAYLMPGTNNFTENQSYIDDFDDSQSRISLMDQNSWKLASTPVSTSATPNPDFNPTIFNPDDHSLNYYRRLMSWYNIDPRFYGLGGSSPLTNQNLSNHMSRRVRVRELFSSRDLTAGMPSYINTFDLTYYPERRGPYNLNEEWAQESNEHRWAGITRALSVTNLRQTNIEYVEFWMLDPYADGMNNAPNGRLLMHVGNVSEDLLRDGNIFYENGLRTQQNPPEESIWGRQPSDYPILYSFDTEGEARRRQDVGYDGLHDDEELTFPGYDAFTNYVNPVTNEVDPAADNFVFYLDERWDNAQGGESMIERYRYFRNPEGNSPSGSLEASSATPDTEDINNDYNLDRIESYNQYTIALNQNQLNLDHPFIVDMKEVEATFENGQVGQAKWFLFRVPLSDFDTNAGAANRDVLSSARYMRIIAKGFNETTTFRFGSLDMVRSDWRRYERNIAPNNVSAEGETVIDVSNLAIGTVNVEENSTGIPPYILPPGIIRERFQTNAGLQNQNEASMVLNISNLRQNDARGVFRNINLDLRRFKRIRMFSHVHAGENSNELEGDLKLFLRLGSDLSHNYYEYEIPLQYTPLGATSVDQIWPENNMFDISTDMLVEAKKMAYEAGDLNRFMYPANEEGDRRIYVNGRPSLGNVTTVMIGVRNTSNQTLQNAIIWVNELRLSEIDNQGGYAAAANLAFNLGDFAQINASGSLSTVGFGALDMGPVDRQQEDMLAYNINAAVNVDKFLPDNWGVKIPMTYTLSEQFIDPRYNPLDNDIEFAEDPRRDQLEQVVRTYNKQTTLAFNNIRKERVNTQRPQRFYDVENLSVSVLYNNNYSRDIYTTYLEQQDLRASINYNYGFRTRYYEPLKDWYMVHDTARSKPYLNWLKEFNINPLPTRLAFRSEIMRTYMEQMYRDINSLLDPNLTPVQFNPIYSNNFLFNWQYNVGFDLTRAFRIDFNSATRTLTDAVLPQADKHAIFKNLFTVGRPVNYMQTLQINYRTPLRLLPYFEWANVELGYLAGYNWNARLFNQMIIDGEEANIGNLAQNNQTWTAVGNFDFDKLYNKFPVFERLNQHKNNRRRELDSLDRAWDRLQEQSGGLRTINRSRVNIRHKFGLKHYALMAVQSIKRGQFNWNRTSGIILPGMLAEPNFIGQGGTGPGPSAEFMFGSQFDIRRRAVEMGWVSNSPYLTEPYTSTVNNNFTGNLQIEPIPLLRIDVNFRRVHMINQMQSGFNTITFTPNGVPVYGYESAFNNIMENFTVSTISLFSSGQSNDVLYNRLLANAQQVSMVRGNQMGLTDTSGDGFAQGLGLANAEVLLPAFLATYEGRAINENNMGFVKKFPLPNWNVIYTGLLNTPFFAKRFDRFEIQHNYNSSYNVTGVQSNLQRFAEPIPYDAAGNIITDVNGNPVSGIDGNQNLYTEYTYGAIAVTEQFSPLAGVEMTLRNSMQFKAQYNRDRIVSLSMNNYTLTEDRGEEIILGFGYILRNVRMNFRYMGDRRTLSGDINFRADLNIRDSETRIRRILENDNQVTGGQRLFSLRANAQYMLSQNLNVSLFYEQMLTRYKISTAFPLSTIRAGINATFTFGN